MASSCATAPVVVVPLSAHAVPRVVIASPFEAASFRFRPASRLLIGKDYAAVFANRRVLRSGPFELYYRPLTASAAPAGPEAPAMPELSTAHQTARLGLVMPKRNAKRAVHRNLVKRLAREAFRHVCSQLPPCDLVLRIGRPLNAKTAEIDVQRKQWRVQIDELLLRVPRAS
jgi:ribonuclease P protein component